MGVASAAAGPGVDVRAGTKILKQVDKHPTLQHQCQPAYHDCHVPPILP